MDCNWLISDAVLCAERHRSDRPWAWGRGRR